MNNRLYQDEKFRVRLIFQILVTIKCSVFVLACVYKDNVIRAGLVTGCLVLVCVIYFSEASSNFLLKLLYFAITQDHSSLTAVVDDNLQHNLHHELKVRLKMLIEASRSTERRLAKEYKAFFVLICSKTKRLATKKKLHFCGKSPCKLGTHSTHCNHCTREVVNKGKC